MISFDSYLVSGRVLMQDRGASVVARAQAFLLVWLHREALTDTSLQRKGPIAMLHCMIGGR